MFQRYHIPRAVEALHGFRQALRVDLLEAGLDGPELERVVLAVDEACANAIQHGPQSGAGQAPILVEMAFAEGLLRIRLADVGRFEPQPESMAEDPRQRVASGQAGGLGLHLMHRIMDRVQYRQANGRHWCILELAVGRG